MPYFSQLKFYFTMPFVGLGIIWGMYFLQVYVLDPDGKHDDYLNSAWNYVQTFLFLIYPILSTVVLNCFSCRQILGDWYIVQDLSTQCYTAEWSKHAILAVVGIILYPVGIQ